MTPPKRLKGDARKKWLEVFSTFTPRNLMDVEMACQYCECWADYLTARAIVKKEGMMSVGSNATPYLHPAEGGKNKCIDQMRRLHKVLSPLLKETKEDDFSDL